jgi:hypothetical protein
VRPPLRPRSPPSSLRVFFSTWSRPGLDRVSTNGCSAYHRRIGRSTVILRTARRSASPSLILAFATCDRQATR